MDNPIVKIIILVFVFCAVTFAVCEQTEYSINQYTIEVNGEFSEYVSEETEQGVTVYYPIYKYRYNGSTRRFTSVKALEERNAVKTIVLKAKESNTSSFVLAEDIEKMKQNNMLMKKVCIILTIIGIVLILSYTFSRRTIYDMEIKKTRLKNVENNGNW